VAPPDDLSPSCATSLSSQGYKERTINTVSGAWGLGTWLVFEFPTVGNPAWMAPSGKTAVLVLQATAVGQVRLNLNVRYESALRMRGLMRPQSQPIKWGPSSPRESSWVDKG